MRASHVVAAAVAALVIAAFIASRAEIGDDGAGPTTPGASSIGTPTSTPPGDTPPADTPSAPAAPEQHRTVAAAGVDLVIAAGEVAVGDPRQDGTRLVTTSGRPTYSTGTPGADVVEHGDGSVTVLRDGVAVAALSREARARTADGAETFDLRLGTDAFGSATWAEREGEGGLSLAVVPEPWVRGGGQATLDLLTAQLVAAETRADSDAMRDQLACHHLGAPDKASWNLEPWRPDVGMFATIAARCNPTES